MSDLSALILVPLVGTLISEFGWETAKFAVKGIKNIAPVIVMFVFAILFIGVLTDAFKIVFSLKSFLKLL